MKTRDIGMPDEQTWANFFRREESLRRLGLTRASGVTVEFDCGYGTFTIPAAKIVSETVYAIDIEPEMVSATRAKAVQAGLPNVRAVLRDFVADGTGLDSGTAGYAMLFNILHAEAPAALLMEASRVLAPGGALGIMHWNYDPSTPRGPSMHIRPKPEQCLEWALQAGFRLLAPGIIELPPYHYGMALGKP